MSTPNPRAEQIFAAALEIANASERRVYLEGVCASDDQLRQEVESLLGAHQQAGEFLQGLPTVVASAQEMAGLGTPLAEKSGERIGRYKLLEQIGEGSFGVVWMAEQQEPVRRRVALKIIKLGMDTREVVARFEAERQALALMDHPNIARVFDGGATESGRPYFVMELVRGMPMTKYCDEQRLSMSERLELLVQVCQAVQHAHQKGIIHRDLKPSNILVALHDDKPVPKVIDFGIAKATQQRLTEKTLFTRFNQFIGTPAYMSPEQAGLSSLDIDTRSDIYSLGVLLYELLTGRTPFSREELFAGGYEEICRIIREKEPPKPSTRLSTLSQVERSAIAAQRKIPPEKLGKLVRADLDWIVMKCLEKDRTRRYETANGLTMDLRRFLGGEPVVARPPSQFYRFQKMVRRNKLVFGAIASVVAALFLGLGLSTYLLARALAAEREQSRLRQAAETARQNEAQMRQRAEATGTRLAEALNQLALQRSEELFASGDSATALAHLARLLRQNLSNEVAGSRLLFALTHRNVAWRSTEPLTRQDKAASARATPDEQRVATVSEDKTDRAWDAKPDQPLTESLKHDGPVRCAQFSPDGQRVVTGNYQTARIWDAKTAQQLTQPLEHDDLVSSAQFSPDGRRVLTLTQSTARVWDAKTGQPLTQPLKHDGGPVSSAQFSPDGQQLVTASWDNTARVWDAKTGHRLTEPLKHDSPVVAAQFSPDGQRVVTASYDKTARVWDAKTGQPLTEPLKHQDGVVFAQFSPDGQRVVTASYDKTARVWNAKTGQPLTTPLKHDGQVSSAQFSPDGQRVVTGSWDNTARIWDAKMGQPLTPPLKHDGQITCVQFSPDGQWIVTANDMAARIWDAKTGQQLTQPFKHDAPVSSAQFSPDGQRVVTASYDKTARVWEVPSVSLPVPAWVPKLIEAIAERRVNDEGVLESVPLVELRALRRQLSESSGLDVWTRCAQWFFADHATRTISPFSAITVTEYVQHRIKENTLDGLQEAVKLAPTNGLALARLARAVLAQEPAQRPRQVEEADRYSRQALKYAPREAEASWARAEALERAGNLADELETLKAALEIHPQNPELWNVQGRVLEKTNRIDEAYQSFTKAIELAGADPDSPYKAQSKFYLSRSNFLKRQSRLAAAASDLSLARFPVRDPQAKPEQLDLTPYYNASFMEAWYGRTEKNDLASLPHGLQTFVGVTFDVRGVIQLHHKSPTGEKYPMEVKGISVGRECTRLHFLHAAGDDYVAKGTQIASYLIHYANGQRREIPLVQGQELVDWWSQSFGEENGRFVVAWKGTNEASRQEGRSIRLFKTTWENPLREIPVTSIDFLSKDVDAAPFLVAITAE